MNWNLEMRVVFHIFFLAAMGLFLGRAYRLSPESALLVLVFWIFAEMIYWSLDKIIEKLSK